MSERAPEQDADNKTESATPGSTPGTTASEGPSGFGDAETSVGGADSVPSTPDNVPADDL